MCRLFIKSCCCSLTTGNVQSSASLLLVSGGSVVASTVRWLLLQTVGSPQSNIRPSLLQKQGWLKLIRYVCSVVGITSSDSGVAASIIAGKSKKLRQNAKSSLSVCIDPQGCLHLDYHLVQVVAEPTRIIKKSARFTQVDYF